MRGIVVLSLGVTLMTGAGCGAAVARAMGMKPDTVAPIDQTRTAKHGVCSYVDTSGFLGTSAVKACARAAGSDGTENGLLFTEFTSGDEDRWNPGNWSLVVTAADGRVLVDRTFTRQKRPSCSILATACVYFGRNTDKLSEPWRRGTYHLQYVYAPDKKTVDMTITLQ